MKKSVIIDFESDVQSVLGDIIEEIKALRHQEITNEKEYLKELETVYRIQLLNALPSFKVLVSLLGKVKKPYKELGSGFPMILTPEDLGKEIENILPDLLMVFYLADTGREIFKKLTEEKIMKKERNV